MSSWPQKQTSDWSELTVGGAFGEPLLFKLYETPLIDNGSFEDPLTGWDGSGAREDFGNDAMNGNYVLSCENVPYMHTYFDRTSADNGNEMGSALFTGFIKAIQGVVGGTVVAKVYCDNGTSRIAAPTNYAQIEILVDDAAMVAGVDGLTQWVKFYLAADLSGMTGDYVHFEIQSPQYGTVNYYLDFLKAYEVIETLELECPQTLKLNWRRQTDSNYDMADKTNKDYLRGWKPVFSLGYEYCSREELIRHIGVSENEFNFFAPHRDSCNGEYVRIISDFDSSYFHNRFLGHAQAIPLVGIFMRKKKNIEYGGGYFDVTDV